MAVGRESRSATDLDESVQLALKTLMMWYRSYFRTPVPAK